MYVKQEISNIFANFLNNRKVHCTLLVPGTYIFSNRNVCLAMTTQEFLYKISNTASIESMNRFRQHLRKKIICILTSRRK